MVLVSMTPPFSPPPPTLAERRMIYSTFCVLSGRGGGERKFPSFLDVKRGKFLLRVKLVTKPNVYCNVSLFFDVKREFLIFREISLIP